MKKSTPIPAPAVEPPISWERRNQHYLVREFAALRRRLGEVAVDAHANETGSDKPMDPPAAIDALAAIFELSSFEREIVLLLAGVEMDSALASLCSELAGRAQRNALTFSLMLATLKDPHWSALAPSAPLRRYRLIEMESGHGLTSAPLHIDERVLHYLAGVNRLDERLEGILLRKPQPQWMAEEHVHLANEIAAHRIGELPPSVVLASVRRRPALRRRMLPRCSRIVPDVSCMCCAWTMCLRPARSWNNFSISGCAKACCCRLCCCCNGRQIPPPLRRVSWLSGYQDR